MTKHSWFKKGRPQDAWPGGGRGAGGPLTTWRALPLACCRAPSTTPGMCRPSPLGSACIAALGRSSEPQSPPGELLGGRLLLRGSRPGGPSYRVEWGARHGKERGAQSWEAGGEGSWGSSRLYWNLVSRQGTPIVQWQGRSVQTARGGPRLLA